MESDWITILCSVGILILSGIYIWKSREKQYPIPSYRGWPLVGNFFQVRRERPELTFTEWAKDLGPVISVKMLHKQFVVLSSFDAIHEALVEKGNNFAGRANKNAFRAAQIMDNFKTIVRQQPTPTWRKARKICHKKIKNYGTGMKRIEDISSNMIKTLVDDFKKKDKSFNPKEVVYNTVMNVILTLLLGRAFSKDEELFQKMMRFEQNVIRGGAPSGSGVILDIYPWVRFFRTEAYTNVLELTSLRDDIWEMMKQEAALGDDLFGGDEEDVRLVTALSDAVTEEPTGLTEKHVKATSVIDMALAGTSTTSNSLCIFLNVLSQHPDVQHRLQEEVDVVVGSKRSVSLSDKEDMPYTQATILELLRFTSVAPLAVPHMPIEDTSIQGILIPAGATVLMNLYGLHHDDDFWKDPFEFQPERFLDSAGQLLSASHPKRRHLMPFGAGPRVCLGETLAKSRLFLFITSLAQKFNILPGEVTASCDPLSLIHGIILSSADFEIITEERK